MNTHTLTPSSTKAWRTLQKMKLRLWRIKARIRRPLLTPGQVFYSPGGTFRYRVIGACCRLYDRENLPYPCCSLDWRGKQPSWRRIGRRFVPDVAAQRSPSYCVQLLDCPNSEPFVITLYWMKLSPQKQQWWYSKQRMDRAAQSTLEQSLLLLMKRTVAAEICRKCDS